jgi:hypothetical protein
MSHRLSPFAYVLAANTMVWAAAVWAVAAALR